MAGDLPGDLAPRLARQHGEAATRWVAQLLQKVADAESLLDVRVGNFLTGGMESAVFECRTSEGTEAVAKFVPPWFSARDEASALAAWEGHAAPGLLATDLENGIIVMERIAPGTAMEPGDVGRDCSAVAWTFRAIHLPAAELTHEFPTMDALVRARFQRAYSSAKPGAPQGWRTDLATAERMVSRMGAAGDRYLLHGDAAGKNFLRGGTALKAIDPHPHVGEREFDIANWALLHGDPRDASARISVIAPMLGLDMTRALQWAAVIAATQVSFSRDGLRCQQALRLLLSNVDRAAPSVG